jgi:Tol biopolymer transport system component
MSKKQKGLLFMRQRNPGTVFAFVFLGFAMSGPVVAAGGQAAAAPRRITIDDFFQIRDVDDPQISPEGKWVAYTVTTHKLKDDTNEDRIWMVPSSGGDAVPMTAEGVSSSHPRWSPDGKYLAFLSARDEGKTQVWLLNRNGGEAQQLTDTVQDVRSFEWSPSDDKMVLVLQDATPQEVQAAKYKKEEKELPKTKQPPWIIDRLQFKEDEVGYLDHRRTHLYVLDVATRKMTQATSGDFDDSEPAWSPDGKYLALTSNRTPDADHNYNTDIWVVAADNTDQGKNLRQITTNPGADTSPSWSPDGKWIIFVSQIDAHALDYATKHLAVAPSTGGDERVLTRELDRGVVAPKPGEHVPRGRCSNASDSGAKHANGVFRQ